MAWTRVEVRTGRPSPQDTAWARLAPSRGDVAIPLGAATLLGLRKGDRVAVYLDEDVKRLAIGPSDGTGWAVKLHRVGDQLRFTSRELFRQMGEAPHARSFRSPVEVADGMMVIDTTERTHAGR
jgi:hypothetical protein